MQNIIQGAQTNITKAYMKQMEIDNVKWEGEDMEDL